MKLTSENAMMLGGIISCAGQSHYEGSRKVSDMINDEINDLHARIRNVMSKSSIEEADEEWVETLLKKCHDLRRIKICFEDLEN